MNTNNISTALIGVCIGVGLALTVVQCAQAENVKQPEKIQIVSSNTKPIGWIIPHREITAVEYTVKMKGYTIECVSIVFNNHDGRMLSHAYNKCTEHLDDARRR